jgi:hypothetical protein
MFVPLLLSLLVSHYLLDITLSVIFHKGVQKCLGTLEMGVEVGGGEGGGIELTIHVLS